MKIKNFIRHTRPTGKKEIKQTISDTEKQIKYLKAIGGDEYKINYYIKDLSNLREKLDETT